MKIIKSGNKVIGIIFQDDVVMSDTVSGDYASHIEAPEESIPLSVAEYIESVLESNSQYDRFGKITVDNMSANLSLKDMAKHLIKILVDNMQPDPEVLAEAIWDLFMPVPFPSVEEFPYCVSVLDSENNPSDNLDNFALLEDAIDHAKNNPGTAVFLENYNSEKNICEYDLVWRHEE